MTIKARFAITTAASLVTLAGGSYLAKPVSAAPTIAPPCSVGLLVEAIESSCDNGGTASNIKSTDGGCSYTITCN